MELSNLIEKCSEFLNNTPENYVTKEDAIRRDLIGMKMYDDPLIKVASADDPIFESLKDPNIIHPDVMMPKDWIPDAKSVISYFMPFTDVVKLSNTKSYFYPSDEWLHARIEGQMMVAAMGRFIKEKLEEEGYSAAFPTTDNRFKLLEKFKSNWSERHVAYIAGLGTFSLSKGLITEKGIAGRFGSVVTNCYIEPTPRLYMDPFQNCTMCGMCAKTCPIKAIDASKGVVCGKDHQTCSDYLDKLKLSPHGPNNRVRYGCGKCQVGVPCQNINPNKNKLIKV